MEYLPALGQPWSSGQLFVALSDDEERQQLQTGGGGTTTASATAKLQAFLNSNTVMASMTQKKARILTAPFFSFRAASSVPKDVRLVLENTIQRMDNESRSRMQRLGGGSDSLSSSPKWTTTTSPLLIEEGGIGLDAGGLRKSSAAAHRNWLEPRDINEEVHFAAATMRDYLSSGVLSTRGSAASIAALQQIQNDVLKRVLSTTTTADMVGGGDGGQGCQSLKGRRTERPLIADDHYGDGNAANSGGSGLRSTRARNEEEEEAETRRMRCVINPPLETPSSSSPSRNNEEEEKQHQEVNDCAHRSQILRASLRFLFATQGGGGRRSGRSSCTDSLSLHRSTAHAWEALPLCESFLTFSQQGGTTTTNTDATPAGTGAPAAAATSSTSVTAGVATSRVDHRDQHSTTAVNPAGDIIRHWQSLSTLPSSSSSSSRLFPHDNDDSGTLLLLNGRRGPNAGGGGGLMTLPTDVELNTSSTADTDKASRALRFLTSTRRPVTMDNEGDQQQHQQQEEAPRNDSTSMASAAVSKEKDDTVVFLNPNEELVFVHGQLVKRERPAVASRDNNKRKKNKDALAEDAKQKKQKEGGDAVADDGGEATDTAKQQQQRSRNKNKKSGVTTTLQPPDAKKDEKQAEAATKGTTRPNTGEDATITSTALSESSMRTTTTTRLLTCVTEAQARSIVSKLAARSSSSSSSSRTMTTLLLALRVGMPFLDIDDAEEGRDREGKMTVVVDVWKEEDEEQEAELILPLVVGAKLAPEEEASRSLSPLELLLEHNE